MQVNLYVTPSCTRGTMLRNAVITEKVALTSRMTDTFLESFEFLSFPRAYISAALQETISFWFATVNGIESRN